MKKSFFLLSVVLIVSFLTVTCVSASLLSGAAWPGHYADEQCQNYGGSVEGAVADLSAYEWYKYISYSNKISSIVIDEDDNVYYSGKSSSYSTYDYVGSYTKTGSSRWSKYAGPHDGGYLALTNDGSLIVAGSLVYSYNRDTGGLEWTYTPHGGRFNSIPAIDSSNNVIYASIDLSVPYTPYLASVSTTCGENWYVSVGDTDYTYPQNLPI